MRDQRTNDRRETFRSGVLGCVSGFSVTFQNNRLSWIDIVPDKLACRKSSLPHSEGFTAHIFGVMAKSFKSKLTPFEKEA